MAKQVINIGAAPNDGTGTPLRTSFDYTNQNFTELYNGSGIGTSTNTQVLFNDSGVANGDAGLVYNKTTDALSVGGTLGVTGAATLSSTLAVSGTSTLTGAATVQGLTVGKGTGAVSTNTAFGVNALSAITTGVSNTGVGLNALAAMQGGQSNVAFGANALAANNIGIGMTAIGSIALLQNVSGSYCTAVGSNSAYKATGSNVTAVGFQALTALVAGDSNTAIGWTAGSGQTAGANNGFFGAGSYGDSPSASNSYNYGDDGVATHKFRAGNVVVGTGNVVMSTIGKGIDFTATADSSGTMTSELLNDYEEGTWVPTDSSAAALVLTVSECKYTKIGRVVTIQGAIQYPVNASGVAAKITGLPFAYVGMAPFSIAYTSAALVGGVTTVAYLIGHFSDGPLFYNSIGQQTLNSALSGGTIWFSGTYMI